MNLEWIGGHGEYGLPSFSGKCDETLKKQETSYINN